MPIDGSAGSWVLDRLLDHAAPGTRAGSIAPTGFETLVRVLHPPGEGDWAAAAAAAGARMHPLVQWWSITDRADAPDRDERDPEEGSVPVEVLAALLECCGGRGPLTYAVWDGFGDWEAAPSQPLMPGWGGRDYRLFEGPSHPWLSWPGMHARSRQSANLIWPADRSWCLATEIDLDSTLLACSHATAERVLADRRLEACGIGEQDRLDWWGDALNGPPAFARRDPAWGS